MENLPDPGGGDRVGNAIVVVGSGVDGRGRNVNGLQCGNSTSFQKRLGRNKAHRVEILSMQKMTNSGRMKIS